MNTEANIDNIEGIKAAYLYEYGKHTKLSFPPDVIKKIWDEYIEYKKKSQEETNEMERLI